jgi:hypothetical protein
MAPQAGNKFLTFRFAFIVLVVIPLLACSTNAMLHGSSNPPFSGYQYGEAVATGASSVANSETMLSWLSEDSVIYSADNDASDYTLFQADQTPVFEHSLFDADEYDNSTLHQDLFDSSINDAGDGIEASYSQLEMSTKELLMATPPQDPLSSRPSSSRLSVVASTPNTSFFTSPSIQNSPYESSIPSAPAMSRQVSGQRNPVDTMFTSFDDIPSISQGSFENMNSSDGDEGFRPADLFTRLTFTTEVNENTSYENLSNSPDILRDIQAYNEAPRQLSIPPPSPKPNKSCSKRPGKQTYKYTCEDCDQVFIRSKDTVYVFFIPEYFKRDYPLLTFSALILLWCTTVPFLQTEIILVRDVKKRFSTRRTSRNTTPFILERNIILAPADCSTPVKTTCNATSMEKMAKAALSSYNTSN